MQQYPLQKKYVQKNMTHHLATHAYTHTHAQHNQE